MQQTATGTRSRWWHFLWIGPVVATIAVIVVLVAQWLRAQPDVQAFLLEFPGASELPAGAPVGIPVWLSWQHGLNSFLMLFVVSTGLQLRRGGRPSTFWRRGDGVRIGLPTWAHISLNVVWMLNGALYYVLLFATGQWVRVVPTNGDIVPNALSAALQYASLDWPTENPWVNYNALQVLSYTAVIFVAAPLAILTGLRAVPALAARLRPLDKRFPVTAVKTVHFWIMVFFLAFTAVHVFLVLATGAQRNLNAMYAARDDAGGWLGVALFAASLVVMAAAAFAVRPRIVAALASLTGTVIRR